MPVYTGVTEVVGYVPILTQYTTGNRIYLRFPTVEPALKFPVLYGDVSQIAANFPAASLFTEIYHQRIWMDSVEIKINREYGTFPTILIANWAVNQLPYELTVY